MSRSCFLICVAVIAACFIYSCAKDKGIDPSLAYTDLALLDSCTNDAAFVYYKNDPNAIYPGVNGPHGTFKLKFNHKAYAQLTDMGKLPVGSVFANGSMIVKEVVSGATIIEYALMYKKEGAWVWAEIHPDKSVKHSVRSDHSICTSCHNQAGNRDLVDTFIFH
jgi:hypothetical protein